MFWSNQSNYLQFLPFSLSISTLIFNSLFGVCRSTNFHFTINKVNGVDDQLWNSIFFKNSMATDPKPSIRIFKNFVVTHHCPRIVRITGEFDFVFSIWPFILSTINRVSFIFDPWPEWMICCGITNLVSPGPGRIEKIILSIPFNAIRTFNTHPVPIFILQIYCSNKRFRITYGFQTFHIYFCHKNGFAMFVKWIDFYVIIFKQCKVIPPEEWFVVNEYFVISQYFIGHGNATMQPLKFVFYSWLIWAIKS